MFDKIIKVEGTNPNTGELVQSYRAVDTESSEELRILGSKEDLQNAGKSVREILSKLVRKKTMYGECLVIRRTNILDLDLFEEAEELEEEEIEEEAPKKTRKKKTT